MSWVPVIAWLTALAVAAALLGFCAYEIHWKAQRLRADVGRLEELRSGLQRLQADVATTQARAAQAQRPTAAGVR